MLGFKARDAESQSQRRDFGFDNRANFAFIFVLDFYISRQFNKTADDPALRHTAVTFRLKSMVQLLNLRRLVSSASTAANISLR